jgi:hypothetical protein
MRTHNYDGIVDIWCRLGNNAISIASGSPIVHVSGRVNGGRVGNNAVSVASGTSIVVVGGDVSGGDVGEGIHWSDWFRTSS